MLEKLLIILLPLIFLGSFTARNLGVKRRVRGRIRAADPLVNASILCMTLSIAVITGGIFHGMVLKEEAHLQRLHGEVYARYRQTTGRYLPCRR